MLLKGISLFILGIGVFVLMQVLMPVLAFQTWELFAYDKEQELVDPHPQTSLNGFQSSNVLGVSVENIDNFPVFIGNSDPSHKPPYQKFSLTIPKINLENIDVRVNSNIFEQFLGHFPGSALPGERGNVFISGHSSISALWPGVSKQAFFVNLPKIKKGDEIILDVLGQEFVYVVSGMKIVDPKETFVLNPPDTQGRYLSLMTCVPPGFNTKRLVVLAKLK